MNQHTNDSPTNWVPSVITIATNATGMPENEHAKEQSQTMTNSGCRSRVRDRNPLIESGDPFDNFEIQPNESSTPG